MLGLLPQVIANPVHADAYYHGWPDMDPRRPQGSSSGGGGPTA